MPKAYVLINVELGTEEEVLRELRSDSRVKEAYFVYGPYDLIAKIEIESIDRIKEIVNFKIRKLNNVRSTQTMTVVEGI